MARENNILSTGYRATKLNQLKADFLTAAVEATDNGRGSLTALYTIGAKYAELFKTVKPEDSDERADEYISLVLDVLELSAGKFELTQKGGNLWIASGHYKRAGEVRQYKRATYSARKELKALGCCWSANNSAWYYNRRTVKEREARRLNALQAA